MSAEANQAETQDQNTCCQPGRKVVLAGIGAWSLAQEKAEQVFNRLVEQGEIAEKNGRTRLNALKENSRKQSESKMEDFSNVCAICHGKNEYPHQGRYGCAE